MNSTVKDNPSSAGRIIDVTLDSNSLVTRSADIEIERHKAIADLLHDNAFQLTGGPDGPYRLSLSFHDGHFIMDVYATRTREETTLSLPLDRLRQQIVDYVALCDNFYKTARAGQIHKLEAIDAGRRAIHDDAAEILIETLENKATIDKATARRLFSLLYVLHMRGITGITS